MELPMKLATQRLALLAVLSLAATAARADQCAWISKAQANKAKGLVKAGDWFSEFCEPCGDKAPSRARKVKSVSVGTPDPSYFELQINGEGVDLAYIFVARQKDGRYDNLSVKAGCPAEGVSKSVNIGHKKDNKQGAQTKAGRH
jgi:hypothetical protein